MRFLRFERSTTGDVQLDQWEWAADEATLMFGDEAIRVLGVTVVREQTARWLHSMLRSFVGLQSEPSVDRICGCFADTESFVSRMAQGQARLTSIDGCPAEGFIRWVKGNEFELIARIDAVTGSATLPFPAYVVPSATPDAR